jgi:hypothetical protein
MYPHIPRPVLRKLPQRRWTKVEDYTDPPAHCDAGVMLSDFADRNYFHKEGKVLPP